MILERLVVEIDSDLRGSLRGFKELDRGVDQLEVSMKGLGQAVAVVSGTIAGSVVALGEFAEEGGRVLNVQRAFQSRTRGTINSMGLLRDATNGLVSDFQLMEQANVALTLGSAENVEGFADLAKTAQALGRALGLDTAFALNSLNIGIARQSRLVLDNLGLIVSVEEANKKYAAALGTTADKLDDNQKKEAFRLEAMEQARAKVEELGGVTLNAGDAWTQFKVELRNAVAELQTAVAESGRLMALFEGMTLAVRSMRAGVSPGGLGVLQSLETSDSFEVMTARFRDFVPFIDRFRGLADELAASLTEAEGASEGLADILRRQANSAYARGVAELNAELEEFGILATDLPAIMDAIARGFERTGQSMADAGTEAKTLGEQLAELDTSRGLSGLSRGTQLRVAFGGIGQGLGPFGRRTGFEPEVRDSLGRLVQPGGPLATLADRTQHVADNMRPLGRGLEDSTNALEDFGSGAKSALERFLDPAQIGSQLASQGIGMILGAVGDVLFGPDYVTALEENTRALRQLSPNLSALEFIPESIRTIAGDFFDDLESRQRVSGILELTRRRIAAQDLEGSDEFAALQGALASAVTGSGPFGVGGLRATVASLTPETAGDYLNAILDQVEAGTFDVSQLGGLSLSEFLDILGELESLGDSAGEASDALKNVANAINQPTGFKAALERFLASDPVASSYTTDPGRERSTYTFGDFNMYAAPGEDPVLFFERFREEMRRQMATGGADDFWLAANKRPV